MYNPIQKYREWRERRLHRTLAAFAHAHSNKLIIVCDPKTDAVFVAFRDKQTFNVIKRFDGKRSHMVREMLKHSRFKDEVDGFIGALAEELKLSVKDGNHFYQLLDGALFNIAKALRLERAASAAEKRITKRKNITPTPAVRVNHATPGQA